MAKSTTTTIGMIAATCLWTTGLAWGSTGNTAGGQVQTSDQSDLITQQAYLYGTVETLGIRAQIFRLALQYGVTGAISNMVPGTTLMCNGNVIKVQPYDCLNGAVSYVFQGSKENVDAALEAVKTAIPAYVTAKFEAAQDTGNTPSVTVCDGVSVDQSEKYQNISVVNWTSTTRCIRTPQTINSSAENLDSEQADQKWDMLVRDLEATDPATCKNNVSQCLQQHPKYPTDADTEIQPNSSSHNTTQAAIQGNVNPKHHAKKDKAA